MKDMWHNAVVQGMALAIQAEALAESSGGPGAAAGLPPEGAVHPWAYCEAYRLCGQIQALNLGLGPGALVFLAYAADDAGESGPPSREYCMGFGHCLVMEALGHGVSWFDDHAEFELHFPVHFEIDPWPIRRLT